MPRSRSKRTDKIESVPRTYDTDNYAKELANAMASGDLARLREIETFERALMESPDDLHAVRLDGLAEVLTIFEGWDD